MKNLIILLLVLFAFNACQSAVGGDYDRVYDESELPQSVKDAIKADKSIASSESIFNEKTGEFVPKNSQDATQNAPISTQNSQNLATTSTQDDLQPLNQNVTQDTTQSTQQPQNQAQNSQQATPPPNFDPFEDDDEITPMDYDPYEFLGKIIIKLEEPENFELIDLKQRGIRREKPVFDSSKEIAKNNIYLRYEDTDQDFALIAGYNEALFTELGVSTDGENFVTKVFERFIDGANGDKSVQLLNFQHNLLYESKKNFAALTKDPKNKQLSISPMLGFETSFNRMYLKSPEYLLFIIVDECYFKDVRTLWWHSEFVRVNFTYKIVRLSDKILVKSEKLGFSFEMPKDIKSGEKYDYIAAQVGDELKTFFPEVVGTLKAKKLGKM